MCIRHSYYFNNTREKETQNYFVRKLGQENSILQNNIHPCLSKQSLASLPRLKTFRVSTMTPRKTIISARSEVLGWKGLKYSVVRYQSRGFYVAKKIHFKYPNFEKMLKNKNFLTQNWTLVGSFSFFSSLLLWSGGWTEFLVDLV